MNFITDKEQISFIDLMEYLPVEIPGMCEPVPQKCSFDFKMDIDYYQDRREYMFFYGDFVVETDDSRILYTSDKFKPAYVVSNNPLEGILNLVYWYLKFIVNDYREQSWLRNYFFTHNPDGLPGWKFFKNSLGHIEPDERDSNRHFKPDFIIKKGES